MPTLTDNLGVTLMEPAQSQPHVVVNEALVNFDKSIAGRLGIVFLDGGPDTITLTGSESTNHILHVTATFGVSYLIVQAVPKSWIVVNDGSHNLNVQRAAQVLPVVVSAGTSAHLYCDGTDVRAIGASP